ncbi:MAG: glycosyltransferase family 4 protein [Planctomycetota bacterium]|nr:glycosyltransferase family 4 protein [Planctomycetota bacterium]MDI6786951.1 glycosyltransferase family 4 protein [Planctomycetota bacterium]
MKIAFVIYNFSESKGGVERYAYYLAQYLIKEGDEVHIFCHRLLDENVPVQNGLFFHPVKASGIFSYLKYLSFANNSARLLKQGGGWGRFDIIHGFGRTYLQDVYRVGSGCHWEYLKHRHLFRQTPKAFGIGRAINFLGKLIQYLNPRNQVIMHLERKSFSTGAYRKIICISEKVKEEIQRYYNISDENIRVIYNGVDPERFNIANRAKYRSDIRKQYGLTDNAVVLLFVGSGFERKGLRYAIESLSLIPESKRSSLKLLVVGRGNIPKYQKLCRKYGIENQVIFAGAQSAIEQYYSASDIFLFPTLYEPFGTACLEAMASGLPVITTEIAGVSEIISNAIDSFVVVNPSDTQTISEKTIFLLDKTWRENMGRAAYLCASKYSLQDNFRSVKEVYIELLRNGEQTAPKVFPKAFGTRSEATKQSRILRIK